MQAVQRVGGESQLGSVLKLFFRIFNRFEMLTRALRKQLFTIAMRPLILVFIFCPLLALCQSLETVVQKGHELAVVAVAISPDSNYIASGSKDKSAKLWEMSTGREVRSYLGHEATVTSLEFTADGKTLITGSNDKSIRFWDVSTWKRNLFHSY